MLLAEPRPDTGEPKRGDAEDSPSPARKLGAAFAAARAARQLSVEQATAATRITRRFLLAIEAGDFDQLPKGLFRRSFIRSYAQYLGLDEATAVASFLAATNLQDVAPVSSAASPAPSGRRGGRLITLAAPVQTRVARRVEEIRSAARTWYATCQARLATTWKAMERSEPGRGERRTVRRTAADAYAQPPLPLTAAATNKFAEEAAPSAKISEQVSPATIAAPPLQARVARWVTELRSAARRPWAPLRARFAPWARIGALVFLALVLGVLCAWRVGLAASWRSAAHIVFPPLATTAARMPARLAPPSVVPVKATRGDLAKAQPQPPPASSTSPLAAEAATGGPAPRVVLQIAANAPVWIQVTAGRRQVFAGSLPAGAQRVIRAAPPLRLVATSSTATRLTLDGQMLPRLEQPGGMLLVVPSKDVAFQSVASITGPATAPAPAGATPGAAPPAAEPRKMPSRRATAFGPAPR